MNEHDSERMAAVLHRMGYSVSDRLEGADLALVNTCSIRQKAEEKAYSLLGRIAQQKKKQPDMLVVVTGCLAQQEGERLFSRFASVNLIIGPRCIYKLSDLLLQTGANKRVVSTDLDTVPECPPDLFQGERRLKAFVSIMSGCNNFCSYCIVPYVRGREFSRRSEEILKEVEGLVEQGVREITLIGQNVNSYALSSKGEQAFAELVRKVDEIEGLERLRFTTSHPKDISDELISCFGTVRSLCEHIHLPVQSGSDRILKKMNRKYTRSEYLDKIGKLKEACAEVSITTDIMVGFPGETDSDYQATLDLIKEVKYAGAFAFKYSDRPPAKSVSYKDKLPDEVKQERLSGVLALQKELRFKRNQTFAKKTVEVLVEGQSKSCSEQWMGRTRTNDIVNFTGEQDIMGKLIAVRIEKACLHSLKGSLSQHGNTGGCLCLKK